MRPVRLLLIGLGAVVCLLLLAIGVASTSWFQTWAARMALASEPMLHGSIGTLSAGTRRHHLEQLHLERAGAVLTVPSLDADVPILPVGFSRYLDVERLIAHGWTLDLTRLPAGSAASEVPVVAAPAAVVEAFSGLFRQLELPADIALDGLDLEGDVLLPPLPGYTGGKAHVVVKGGGLSAGTKGTFDFDVQIALDGPKAPVQTLQVKGTVSAEMATPRTFRAFSAQVVSTAMGPQFPKGVTLAMTAGATHSMGGESYLLTLSGDAKQLASIQADFPENTKHLAGTWSVDVSDQDLAPFVIGRGLPNFSAVGQGSFDTDAAFTSLRTQGRLSGEADKLGRLSGQLSAIEKLTLETDFDLALSQNALRVDKLSLVLAGDQPVARVEALQPFAYDTVTGELKVADPDAHLVGLNVLHLPIGWVQPFLPGYSLQADAIHGILTLDAGAGGLAARSPQPIVINNLTVSQGSRALCTSLDIQAIVSGLYSPQGWQVQLSPLTVKGVGVQLLSLQAKAGQLSGKGQPLTATGHWEVSLPALMSQPVTGGKLTLTGGLAKGDVTVTLGAKRQIETSISVTQLAVDPSVASGTLPEVTAGLRADLDGGGSVTFRAPVKIKNAQTTSELTIEGTAKSGLNGSTFELRVGGDTVCVDDLKLLGALATPPQAQATAAQVAPAAAAPAAQAAPAALPAAPDKVAFWSAFEGSLALSLKKVVLNQATIASDIDASLHLAPGALTIERFKASFADAGNAKVGGVVSFDASAPKPYALTGELSVDSFNSSAVLKSLDPAKPPIVEGVFGVTGSFGGRGASLDDLEKRVEGELHVSSHNGTFNALTMDLAVKTESAGRIASAVASIGSLASALTGRKEGNDIASAAQALSEFCKFVSPIHYDQLAMTLTRGSDLNVVVKDFSLLSPDLRLLGGGQITWLEDQPVANDPLSLKFELRAHGRTVDLLKKANALDTKPDDLGYLPCTVPIVIGGTVGKVDLSDFKASLLKLAITKSDLFDRLLGK